MSLSCLLLVFYVSCPLKGAFPSCCKVVLRLRSRKTTDALSASRAKKSQTLLCTVDRTLAIIAVRIVCCHSGWELYCNNSAVELVHAWNSRLSHCCSLFRLALRGVLFCCFFDKKKKMSSYLTFFSFYHDVCAEMIETLIRLEIFVCPLCVSRPCFSRFRQSARSLHEGCAWAEQRFRHKVRVDPAPPLLWKYLHGYVWSHIFLGGGDSRRNARMIMLTTTPRLSYHPICAYYSVCCTSIHFEDVAPSKTRRRSKYTYTYMQQGRQDRSDTGDKSSITTIGLIFPANGVR